jgi:hypothetical protein
MARKTRVSTASGARITLRTDETYTLAFDGQESTPDELRQTVCRRSLWRIYRYSPDSNEQSKAGRALGIKA